MPISGKGKRAAKLLEENRIMITGQKEHGKRKQQARVTYVPYTNALNPAGCHMPCSPVYTWDHWPAERPRHADVGKAPM